MLRGTLRIPFHVPEHKGFFVKLLFILDSPSNSRRARCFLPRRSGCPAHGWSCPASPSGCAAARCRKRSAPASYQLRPTSSRRENSCKKVVCPRGSEQTTAQRRNGLWSEKAYFASRTETVTSLASVLKSNAPPSCSAKRTSYTFWARSLPEAFSSDQFPVKAWYWPSVPSA